MRVLYAQFLKRLLIVTPNHKIKFYQSVDSKPADHLRNQLPLHLYSQIFTSMRKMEILKSDTAQDCFETTLAFHKLCVRFSSKLIPENAESGHVFGV